MPDRYLHGLGMPIGMAGEALAQVVGVRRHADRMVVGALGLPRPDGEASKPVLRLGGTMLVLGWGGIELYAMRGDPGR